MIVKGSKDAARCSWLGELDSQEESDELSNEFDFANEILDAYSTQEELEENDIEDESTEIEEFESVELEDDKILHGSLSGSSREASKYLDNIEQWSLKSQTILVKKLMANLNRKNVNVSDTNINNNASDTFEVSISGIVHQKDKKNNKNNKYDIHRTHESLEKRVTTDIEDYQTEGEDLLDDPDHLFNSGKYNQNNLPTDKEDKSDEEPNSSWSSSEEALDKCEGVIHNNQLAGQLKCGQNSSDGDFRSAMTEFSYLVEKSGTYSILFHLRSPFIFRFLLLHLQQ